MADPRTAYADHADASSAPSIQSIERALLCDLLDQVGPDHPTLCDGWDTHHLAAHLRNREAGPVGLSKQLLAGGGDKALEATVASIAFADLVEQVRNGPPLLTVFALPKVGTLMNDLEYFVHHEDVRRAAPDWQVRVLPQWAEDELWRRLRGAAKLLLRKTSVGIVFERTDTGDTVIASSGDDPATVAGLPSEIVLDLFGRRSVAEVDVTGSDAAVAAYTRKRNRV